jgi:von Willebrand factor type A domain
MRRSQRQLMRVALMSALVGCGFAPGASQSSGSGGSTPAGQGGSGTPGSGGAGLSSGSGGGGIFGSGGGGGDVVIDSGVTTSCGQTNVNVMPEPPDILIVQDKSGSMTEQANGCCCGTTGSGMCGLNVNCNGNVACGANSKWSQVTAAIDTVVMTTQAMVNWGLIFFGSDNMCGVSATPNVAIAANDYTAISQAYANNTPGSFTPTRTAVNAAAAYMATLTDTNPKYLLLATDGLPNCIPGGGNVGDDDSAGAKTAVMNAATAGFKTFVVGIGNTNGVTTLNQLAMAGGEAQVGSADGNSFYEVNSTADLVTALNKIVGMVASCTIPLTGVNGTLEKVAVSAKDANGNTVEVMPDPTNGWSYTDASMTTIVLNGTACSDLQSGALSGFQFIYTCSMGTICIDRKSDGTCATGGP